MQDKDYLQLATDQANKSVSEGGFPAGAVIIRDRKVITEGITQSEYDKKLQESEPIRKREKPLFYNAFSIQFGA
jgi:pyrimidine deaminase RibD-like protein